MGVKRAAPKKPASRRRGRMGRPPEGYDARTELLRGAARAFGRAGYGTTTVEAICDASGVSRRTFYRFFRDKEDVFEALFDTAVAVLVEAARSAVTEARTPIEKVEAGVEAYLRVQATAGGLASALILEALRPESKFARRKAQV
ncbi:MAG: TetR/AcrR family transcriptional regulator, partial [Candidatus Methylomirabilis sp.]|nr:TetR/AcrR family transcriptional regulator [Deltaproteobacteria bacterium]